MNKELEQKLIRIALNFIYHALNGIHENNSRYVVTVYNFADCVEIYLHDLHDDSALYLVKLNCDGTISVEQPEY